MLKKTPFLLLPGLALLLAGWIACKPAPEQDEAMTSDAGKTAPAPVASHSTEGSPTTASPALGDAMTPGTPGTPADNTPLAVNDLPDVVAKVNGQTIKKQELIQGAQVVQMRLAQMGRPATPSAAFYRQVLSELIAITLLQQDAKAQGVAATDAEVQHQIDGRMSAFPSKEAYEKALVQSGISEATLRQQARDQISVQKYVQTKLVQNVNVSEQAAREFYEKNKARMHSPERLHLRHILVKVDAKAPAAEKEKARQKADGLLKRVQAGEDFAQVVRESSDDTASKPQGGDLGWLVKGQTPPPFEKAAFALTKPNELSGVVESPYGFHIIQLLERQQPGEVPFEQAKERITNMLKQRQAQQQVQARVAELRAKGKVEVFI